MRTLAFSCRIKIKTRLIDFLLPAFNEGKSEAFGPRAGPYGWLARVCRKHRIGRGGLNSWSLCLLGAGRRYDAFERLSARILYHPTNEALLLTFVFVRSPYAHIVERHLCHQFRSSFVFDAAKSWDCCRLVVIVLRSRGSFAAGGLRKQAQVCLCPRQASDARSPEQRAEQPTPGNAGITNRIRSSPKVRQRSETNLPSQWAQTRFKK